MQPPDLRDTDFAAAITTALVGMIVAVHRDDPEQATAELGKLLAAIVAHKKACSPDRALARAVARLP
jgi:hypothetical protein